MEDERRMEGYALLQEDPGSAGASRDRTGRFIRVLAHLWAGPGTLVGLAFVALARASGGVARRHAGTFEAYGGGLGTLISFARGRALSLRAVTLGHVILARDASSLEEFRAHERTHVRQWERWGPLFPIAYLLASFGAWVRGRDPYLANRFEREATESGTEGDGDSRDLSRATPRPTGEEPPILETERIPHRQPERPPRWGSVRIAWAVAIAVDLFQWLLWPLFAEGVASPLNDVVDVITAAILIKLLGWHWAFLPAFIAEIIPGVDLVPTWTAAVFLATRGAPGRRPAA